MSLAPGSSIGGFEVISRLGAGGMGEVYRARDRELGREVAIKVLRADLAGDADRLARIDREARVLASLNHPHIAAIYGIEHAGGSPALVLELVDGPTLADRLTGGALTPAETLSIGRQVAEALEAAHQRGIVHRDLKPANIKVRADGTVKVLDFGLAKTVVIAEGVDDDAASTRVSSNTSLGTVVGTAAYMSPEQARGHPVDCRTDIWAFGCVLFEMLSGQRAFGGATITDTIARVLERDPEWSALPADVQPDVVRIVRRCLRKDARRRFRDIADVRLDLEDTEITPETRAAGAFKKPAASPIRGVVGPFAWATLGALITAAVTFGLTRPAPDVARAVMLTVSPPRDTTFPDSDGAPWPSISPDGRTLAFVAIARGGQQRLWIRHLNSTQLRPLEGTDGAIRPFWSPDSRSLGYFANGSLARVDVDSGAVRVLAEAPYSGGLEGTWGDGVIVWSAIGGIRRIPAGGGEAALLLKDSQDANAAAPSFLPDGRRFLYTELKPRREDSRACIGSLDSPAPTCFWNETTPVKFAAPGYLLLARNGTFLAQPFDPSGPRTIGEPVTVSSELVAPNALYTPPSISASTNGVLAYFAGADSNQLRWLDRTGRPLGPPLGGGNRPTLSPDGTRLLVQRSERGTNNTDIWLLDLRDGTETRFTTSRVRENWPVFSSDGRLVAYAAEGGERSGLHVKATDGSGPDEALDTPGVNPDWSPDGRHLLYQLGNPKTGFDLFALSLTNRQTIPIAVTEHGEREGRFSPDGRWIAYDSTESGRREVWIQPFPPATSRWQVSTTGGVSPQWRRDGKELYYVRADGTLVAHEMRLSTGRPEWGTPQGLFQTLAGGGTYASYAPARDGQRFLLSLPPEPENAAPITVVVNWTSVLRN